MVDFSNVLLDLAPFFQGILGIANLLQDAMGKEQILEFLVLHIQRQ